MMMFSEPSTEREWDAIGASQDHEIDIFSAATLLARDEYPELDPNHCNQLLERHLKAVRDQLPDNTTTQERLLLLSRYLFDDVGFRGNEASYYDPRNSYISDVLERRLGIPLSLSILHIALAHRLDIPLEGISFPGHFLVRLEVDEGILVFDPFNRGRSINAEELRTRVHPFVGDIQINDQLLFQMLEPASTRSMVMRMLRNLVAIYTEQNDLDKALRCLDRLTRVAPMLAEPIRDRGLMYQRLGHYAAARADLTHYLNLKPEAEDAEIIHALLANVEIQEARLH